MTMVIGEDFIPAKEPKAGSIGVFSIVLYGLISVVAVFVAAFFWLDDGTLAAALGIGSLAIPVTTGFVVAEVHHQRTGALAFVLTAAIVAGAAGSYAVAERDDWNNRRNFVVPDTITAVDAE